MKRKRTSDRPKLSRRAEKMILALLEHPTQEKAAAAVGVGKTTLWRWRKDPDFQKALLEAHRDAYSQTIARLQQGSAAAAATLLRVMTDPAATASSRVRAAQCVLDKAAHGIVMQDLEVRVRAMEQRSQTEETCWDALGKAA